MAHLMQGGEQGFPLFPSFSRVYLGRGTNMSRSLPPTRPLRSLTPPPSCVTAKLGGAGDRFGDYLWVD